MFAKKPTSSCCHTTCTTDADISKLLKVSAVIFIFMIVELWGHYKTNSLSLLADCLHLLVDIMSFAVSLASLHISKKPASKRMTFGYHRLEIIGSLISIALIWIAVGYLIFESVHKIVHPKEIDGGMFFVIAVVGLFVNLFAMYILHGKSSDHHLENENLNLRAAYVHVIGDVIQSIGVIIAGIFTYFYPKNVIFDVMCTILFSGIVLASTALIIYDALLILSEATPKDIKTEEIKDAVLEFDNVFRIIHLHVWSLSTNKKAAMISVLTDNLLISDYENLVHKIKVMLETTYNIDVVNVQIDTPNTYHNDQCFLVDGTRVDIQETHIY